MMQRTCLAAFVLVAGCFPGGPGVQPDADVSPDARWPDARPVVPLTCGDGGTGRFVSGELIELASTTTSVVGIEGAAFTQRGGSASGTTTSNGHFELCAEQAELYVFDIDAPGDHVDAIMYVRDHAFTVNPDPFRLRTATLGDLSAFYQARGLQLDMTKAQLLVLSVFNSWDVGLEGGSHGPAYAGSEDLSGTISWSPGTMGRYVLFPNVAPAGATVTLHTPTAQPEIPVEPGKLTIAVTAEYFCFTGKAPCI